MNLPLRSFHLLLLFILKKSAVAINTGYTQSFVGNVLPGNIYNQSTSSASLASPFVDAFEENLYNIPTYDSPLFLTPYIESGQIEQGRVLSRVAPLPNAPYVLSYSGLITVNKEYNSNLFFWFFPALSKSINAPIILWLQGGPGATGLMGLFLEHGPYILYSNTTAGLREHSWNIDFNVIYIDSPVGTGFSFTDNEKGYATVEDQVANDLYSFLKQFFKIYYEYRYNDFYICGESYAGKHVPYLGYKIHIEGPPAEINFKGIAIGNGIIDFNSQRGHGTFYYNLGIVDSKQAAAIDSSYNLAFLYQQNGKNLLAIQEFNKLFGFYKGTTPATTSIFTNFTGFEFKYNLLFEEKPEDYLFYETYIQSPQSRNAIHVGNLKFHGEDVVQHYLLFDLLHSSAKDKVAVLMDNYKVLLYSGQLDLSVPYVSTENLLQNLTWKYSNEYKASDRKIWKLNHPGYLVPDLAGYVRSVGDFREALVRNAGHLVPHDQPQAGRHLITRFIQGLPIENKP